MTATGYKTLPKRAIWFWGGSPMSFLRYMSLVSFRKYHLDWEMILVLRRGECKPHCWDQEQDAKYYDGEDYRARAMEIPGLESLWLEDAFPELIDYYENQVSDILGWRWIQEGGMKCDMDLLWRAPIDYEAIRDIRAGVWSYKETFAVGVVLGNEPDFFRQLYEKGMTRLQNGRSSLNYQDVGPVLLRDMFLGLRSEFTIATLPNSWIYPFVDSVRNWRKMCAQPFVCGKSPIVPDDCVAVHWYAGGKVAREWNLKPVSEIMAATNLIGDMVRGVFK